MKRFFVLVASVFILTFPLAEAQIRNTSIAIQDLPSLLKAPTNAGTDFYFSFPPCYEEASIGFTNNCKVFVASSIEQTITVEVPGKSWAATQIVKPNDVVEFIIPTGIAQPFLKPGAASAPVEQVYPQAAIHVFSESPIIVYGVTRYNFTSDGFLAIPVSALGTEYIVASYPQYTAIESGFKLVSETTISAAYDQTEVTFEMGGTSSSKTSGGLKPGNDTTFLMNKGDVLCFASDGNLQDISGSYIKASKPVGVVSGNQCANVPAGVLFCDFISEMDVPIFTWGKIYHITPFVGRKNNPIIRIFAKEKNTTIYRDGEPWLMLPGRSHRIDDGFVERRSSDGTPRSVVISADKPIYVVAYNPGQTDDNVSSDPFQLALTPQEQYQKEIVFCTPSSKNSADKFKTHYINLICSVAADNTIPDDMEFAIVIDGQLQWEKVSTRFGEDLGLMFALPVNGTTYTCKQITLPDDGVYRFRAATPFAAYAYGFSSYDSYGFPTGAALDDLGIDDNESPQLTVSKKTDGSVTGTVTDYPLDSSRRSNLGLIAMAADQNYNYKFIYGQKNSYIAGQSQTTDWALEVKDKSKDARAVLTFADRRGNDTTIVVEYTVNVANIEDGTKKFNNNLHNFALTVSPNPISTSGGLVEFVIPTKERTELTLISANGAEAIILAKSIFDKGIHQIKIPVEQLSSGSYILRLASGKFLLEKTVVIVK